MGKIIIEAKDLVKTYQNGKGRLVVLDNINIQIRENSIISIIGESGAGKSTLLNVLSSLDVFDKGELNIKGSNIKVHFNDWIYQQSDDLAINRAYVSKFGINIGSVTLVFLRGKTADNIGPLNLKNW